MVGLQFLSSDSRIGCSEHVAIVELYIDWQSMRKVAEEYNRSKEAIQKQIKVHNLAVSAMGKCPRCIMGNHGMDEWPARETATVTKKRTKGDI